MPAGQDGSSQQESHPVLRQALQMVEAAKADRSLITADYVERLKRKRDSLSQVIRSTNPGMQCLRHFIGIAKRNLKAKAASTAKRRAQQDIWPLRQQVMRWQSPETGTGAVSGARSSAWVTNSQAAQQPALVPPQLQSNQDCICIVPSIDMRCSLLQPPGRGVPQASSLPASHAQQATTMPPTTTANDATQFAAAALDTVPQQTTLVVPWQPQPILDSRHTAHPYTAITVEESCLQHRRQLQQPALLEGPQQHEVPHDVDSNQQHQAGGPGGGLTLMKNITSSGLQDLQHARHILGTRPMEDANTGVHGNTAELTGHPSPKLDHIQDAPWNLSPVRSPGLATYFSGDVLMHQDEGHLESNELQYGGSTFSCQLAAIYPPLETSLNSFWSQPVEGFEGYLAPAADDGSEVSAFDEGLPSPTAVQRKPLPKHVSETAPVVPSTALPPPTPAALELLLRQLYISQDSSSVTADNASLPSYWSPDRQLALFDPNSSMQVPTDRNEIDALQRAMIDQPAVDHEGGNVLHRLASAESHVELPRLTALLNIVLSSVDGVLTKLQVARNHSGMTPVMTAASKGAREGIFDRLLQAAGLEVLSETTNEGCAVHHCLLQAAAEANQVGNQTLRLYLRQCFCNTLEHMQNLYQDCLELAVARQQWPAQTAQQQQRQVQQLLQKWMAPHPKAPGYTGGLELAAAVKAYKTRVGAALPQTHPPAPQVPLYPDEQLLHVLSSKQQLLGTGHDSTYLDTWQPGSDTSSLKGVTWDERGRINGIWLDYLYEPHNSHVKGRLPSSWSLCTNLTVLYLAGSEVSGPLPEALGRLTNLTNIKLHWNMFDGPLPPSWSSLIKLQEMSLHGNRLTGCLPESWSALSSLVSLYVSDNRLSSTLPPCYSRLTSLQGLLLSRNEFSGVLPVELSALTSLKTLDVSGNNFTGSLPHQYSALTQLTSLVLVSNKLTGPLPIEWAQLRQLKQLHVGGNCVEQQVPDSWNHHLTNLCRGIDSIWALRPMRFVMLP